jgi:CDP-glycerol glycerophosphotransferase (TagB/SpsB family)
VHVVEPVPLGGELGYYSGEDMPEKTSMMAHSDVFMTVYSTMVVETAIHDRPIISVCFDMPGGWGQAGKFSLALSEIGEWPTHQRFRQACAGRVALTEVQLKQEINRYFKYGQADGEARRKFIQDEVTFTDGSAGRRTGEFLASLAVDHSTAKGTTS